MVIDNSDARDGDDGEKCDNGGDGNGGYGNGDQLEKGQKCKET